MSVVKRLLRKPVEVDELALADKAARGSRAETLLRDETLQEAFKHLEDTYIGIWRTTSGDEIETRERAHLSLRLLDDLRGHLLSVVRDGAAARHQIEKELSRRQ